MTSSLPEDLPTAIGDEDRDAAERAHLGAVVAPAEKPGTTTTTGAASGRIKRRGAWQVPRTLKVASAYGRARLGLSRVVIEHPAIDIELALGTGRAKIIVPRDAIVLLDDLQTGWKDYRYRPPRRSSDPGGPEIRISGTMGFGRLTARHARR
ncbi:hypothetical protein [Streptomyces formicae]|uniref:Cell wall-active antibiotics response LiaF-like C-terminal domain-containing protein n=1 Tax=Streptomyces formicae TaxID=1616117 RepID=A0A291Q0W8_9ACTN|nr:hypothetical protein [Streptomyces formicae]ATL25163.1 hypothetical protein KY5_0145c [Streptomyces formicae]